MFSIQNRSIFLKTFIAGLLFSHCSTAEIINNLPPPSPDQLRYDFIKAMRELSRQERLDHANTRKTYQEAEGLRQKNRETTKMNDLLEDVLNLYRGQVKVVSKNIKFHQGEAVKLRAAIHELQMLKKRGTLWDNACGESSSRVDALAILIGDALPSTDLEGLLEKSFKKMAEQANYKSVLDDTGTIRRFKVKKMDDGSDSILGIAPKDVFRREAPKDCKIGILENRKNAEEAEETLDSLLAKGTSITKDEMRTARLANHALNQSKNRASYLDERMKESKEDIPTFNGGNFRDFIAYLLVNHLNVKPASAAHGILVQGLNSVIEAGEEKIKNELKTVEERLDSLDAHVTERIPALKKPKQ